MRLTIILAALALGACMIDPGRAEQENMALAARLDAQYGPTCAQRNPRGSDAWAYCVKGFYDKERSDRAAALAQILLQQQAPAANPFYQDPNLLKPRGTNCTSFWSGGIVVTECK